MFNKTETKTKENRLTHAGDFLFWWSERWSQQASVSLTFLELYFHLGQQIWSVMIHHTLAVINFWDINNIYIICFIQAFNFPFSIIVMECLSYLFVFIYLKQKESVLRGGPFKFWGRGGWFWKKKYPVSTLVPKKLHAHNRIQNKIHPH